MASYAYSPSCSMLSFIHMTIHDPGVGIPMSLNIRQYIFHVCNSSNVAGGNGQCLIHIMMLSYEVSG